MTHNEHRGKQYFSAILLAVFFPPLLIVLHEAGHYSAARLLGYSPTFSYSEVRLFEPIDRRHLFPFTLSGPCVDILFCILGVLGLFRLRRSLPIRSSSEVWLWTALAGSGLRWFMVPIHGQRGDEASVSAMLGFHPLFLPLALLPFSVVVAIILIRFHNQNQTLLPLAVSSAFGVLSVIAWLTLLGPALLPKPSGPNKTDAGNGSYGICRVIDAFASAPALPYGLPSASYVG